MYVCIYICMGSCAWGFMRLCDFLRFFSLYYQIEQLTALLSNIELELEKCRLDVDGMVKQEAQLRCVCVDTIRTVLLCMTKSRVRRYSAVV
jgi:hypothetical protein